MHGCSPSLDEASGGRVIAGVGAGWTRAEFMMMGIDFPDGGEPHRHPGARGAERSPHGGCDLALLPLRRAHDRRPQIHLLDAHGWTLLGSTTDPKGYRYRGQYVGDSVIRSATIKGDSVKVKGFSLYSLDEPAQGRVAVRISSGQVAWCADVPAKTSGSPPSTTKNDHPGKFAGQPKTPAPIACPAPPGSPSGAFVLAAEG
jgi:hypothetical protein